MRTLIQAVAVAGTVAAPALAQEAGADAAAAARLDAMTCQEFLAFGPEDRLAVMLAMRAHLNGDPLPDEPLPIAAEAGPGGADGQGGGSGDAGSGEAMETAGAPEADPAEDAASETAASEDAAAAEEPTAEAGDTAAEDGMAEAGDTAPTDSEDGAEPSAEPSAEDAASSPRLTAMRTACEGAPDVLAADAMRATQADYE